MVKRSESGGSKKVVNKGAWTAEEDEKLANYVKIHGDKKWKSFPAKAGLNRCGKSCRLRWLNYLRPGIKRGNISEDEEDLIIRLHNLLGNRWSLIAGRLPGRTDNEIKNHWNTHLSKKSLTITQLNHKLSQKIQTNSHRVQDFASMSPDMSWVKSFCMNSEHNMPGNTHLAQVESAEKDFDPNRFFDFSSITASPEQHPDGSVEFEAMGMHSLDGIYQNLVNVELEGVSGGCLDEQIGCNQLDLDSLKRLLEYEDDDPLFSF